MACPCNKLCTALYFVQTTLRHGPYWGPNLQQLFRPPASTA